MKTILATTDFSEPANNAVLYAAELAKIANAKLILFHVYNVPVLTGESTIVMPEFNDLVQIWVDELERLREPLMEKYGPDLQIECVCKMGFSVEKVLEEYIKGRKIDLVVMGMQGKGFLRRKLFGSVTTSFMKDSNCPVLAINENVKFNSIEKIVFAYDNEKSIEPSVLDPLKALANLFQSHVYVVHVERDAHKLTSGNSIDNIFEFNLDLEGIDHSYHIISNINVIEALNEFIAQMKADLVVIISRKHGFFSSLIRGSNTSKMAFHSSVPLLTLDE